MTPPDSPSPRTEPADPREAEMPTGMPARARLFAAMYGDDDVPKWFRDVVADVEREALAAREAAQEAPAPEGLLNLRVNTNVVYAKPSAQDPGIYLIDGDEYHRSEDCRSAQEAPASEGLRERIEALPSRLEFESSWTDEQAMYECVDRAAVLALLAPPSPAEPPLDFGEQVIANDAGRRIVERRR